MPVSRRLRFEILRRDAHACRYCGAKAPDVKLAVDHVIPTSLGGDDDPTNLVTACVDCNSGKASIAPDSALVADVAADALRWADAMSLAAQERRTAWAMVDYTIRAFETEWVEWGDMPRQADWRSSIERFIANGLGEGDLVRFVRVAMESNVSARDTWRYFCGCCWNEVADRQEIARRIIEDGDI